MTARPPHEMKVHLALPGEPESVAAARHGVGDLARGVGAPETDVKIAVSEAVGNAVVHAFRDGGSGTVTVRAWHERRKLLVTVADDGMGMTPDLGRPGLGLGIPLITKLCDDVRFHSTGRGTTVSMSFRARGSNALQQGDGAGGA